MILKMNILVQLIITNLLKMLLIITQKLKILFMNLILLDLYTLMIRQKVLKDKRWIKSRAKKYNKIKSIWFKLF